MAPATTSATAIEGYPSIWNARTVATSMIHTSEIGMRTFQPRFMNWS